MRGYVEESDEVKTLRVLRRAAERFAGKALLHGWGDVEAAEADLAAAAVAYAATQPRPRKPKAARTKGAAR